MKFELHSISNRGKHEEGKGMIHVTALYLPAGRRACMPRSADVSLVVAGSSSARSRAAPSAVLSRRNSCTQSTHL